MRNEFPSDRLFRLYYILFALLPWSVELRFGPWGLLTPAEPLIALAAVGLLLEWFRKTPRSFRGAGWVVPAWIAWMLVAAAASPLPLAAWKYTLVEIAQIGVFMGGLWFRPDMWPRLIRIFTLSLAGSAVYTLIHHATYAFRTDQAMLAPMPFFSDHNLFSVVCVSAIWLLGSGQAPNEEIGPTLRIGNPRNVRWIIPLLSAVLITAGSRAAWLSMAATCLIGIVLWLPKWRYIMVIGLLAVLAVGGVCRSQLAAKLRADVSSMERLNRYACALRMAADRPLTGFGPGTFQFAYLPYQNPDDMTRISLQKPLDVRGPDTYGRGGGAHSEYLQALAELGWPGLALWLLLVGTVLRTSLLHYFKNRDLRRLFIFLALFSFFLHALVNNFLHDARVAALVWGTIGLIQARSSSAEADR